MDYGFYRGRKIFDENPETDAGGEYILPDSLPDIKKVLYVLSNAHETEKAVNGDMLTLSGAVDYSVMFCAEDGTLKSVNYTSGYKASVNIRASDDTVKVITGVCVPETGARLLNPRKIMLRSRVMLRVVAYQTEYTEPFIEGTQDNGLQFLYKEASSCFISQGKDTGAAASEDISIPRSFPEVSELLGVYLFPYVNSVVPSEEAVTVNGEATAVVVYVSENDGAFTYHSYVTKIPLMRVLAVKDAMPGDECSAVINIYGLQSEAAVDSTGEKRVVELDFNYDVSVLCEKNKPFTYVEDMYSSTYESSAEYKTALFDVMKKQYSTHFTLNGKAPLAALGASAPDEILFATADCNACSVKVGEGGAYVEGKVGISLIALRGGEAEGGSFEIPFRADTEITPAENLSVSCDCRVGVPKLRFDGESVYADMEIYLTVHTAQSNSASYAASLKISSDPAVKPTASILLYYPQPDESLWQIAKKYKVSEDALRSVNSIDPAAPTLRKPLRIPG